jgi:cytidylate kinase
MATSIDLITISREYGSGGSELARALGERLRWRVLDHELVQLVADRLRLDCDVVESLAEHTPSFLQRVSDALLFTAPECPLPEYSTRALSCDVVAENARVALREAAESPPLIVVGHGSQCLFRDRPGTLHIRLVASLPCRVERVCKREKLSHALAADLVRRTDEGRAKYVRRHYGADWRDQLLYHIQLNTGLLSIASAADLVVSALTRTAEPAGV